MVSAVRNPNALQELYGVNTQLSSHDMATKRLVKRVDLPRTYCFINISSDDKALSVGGANDDIGVHSAGTLERIGELRASSGGEMGAWTLQIVCVEQATGAATSSPGCSDRRPARRWRAHADRWRCRRNCAAGNRSSAPTICVAGAGEGIRTPDPIITNDVLYQLSYAGDAAVCIRYRLRRQYRTRC